jgi:hypothetical protein
MLCQYTFFVACSRDPGIITPSNHNCFDHRDYDGLLYTRNTLCRTCNVEKPAR